MIGLFEWIALKFPGAARVVDNIVFIMGRSTAADLPDVAAWNRGGLLRTEGDTGVSDGFYINRKDASDTQNWEELLTVEVADTLYSDVVHDHDADYQPLDADLTAIAALADPNADRGLFWDDSAGTWKHLTFGTGLAVSDVTLNADVPGLVYITGAAFSAISTLNVSDAFSATYRNYIIELNIDTGTNNPFLPWIRFRAGSTTDSSGYDYSYVYNLSNAATPAGSAGANVGEITLGGNYVSGNADVGITIRVFDPQTTRKAHCTFHATGWNATNVSLLNVGWGVQRDATQFDGFTLGVSAGTITGEYRVYGERLS